MAETATTATAEQSTALYPSSEELVGRYNETSGLFIRSDRVIERRFFHPSPIPSPVKCEYCGQLRYYYGFLLPTSTNVMRWSKEPETCICERAQAAERARRKKRDEDERRAEAAAKVERIMRKSGIRARFLERTFDSFVVSEANKRAFTAAKRYADNFNALLPKTSENGRICAPETKRNGLFITGAYGTGKTHLAAAIANELMNRGTAVICMTMIDLLQRIKSTFDNGEMSEERIMQTYEDIPLLIIDDIGSEQPTEWGISKIYAIINARYEAYMPVVITTNYGGAELIRRMTPHGADNKNAEKTLDRLKEMCAGVELCGESWRTRPQKSRKGQGK